MLNNFIGGGQVFLHKLRMLRQVAGVTIFVSLLSGSILAWSFNSNSANKVDWDGAITYSKAKLALALHPALSVIALGHSKANVDAYSNGRLWKKRMLASSVLTSNRFLLAWRNATEVIYLLSLQAFSYGGAAGFLVFLLWSKFGKNLEGEKRNEGSGAVLTAIEVSRILRRLGKCSNFKIGKMPLVKDMETRHFLVTGSTGSGKTNFIHNLLPQVVNFKQPAVVIDQTGEMISKYYNPKRGDIIFNPFDARSKAWDFWADCGSKEDLERFSNILIGFNRKQSGAHSDPFWENAAESLFNICAEFLRAQNGTIDDLVNMVCHMGIDYMKAVLGTDGARYLSDARQTSSSILSVLSTNSRPLTYLSNIDNDDSFSLKEYFANVKNGSSSWLFLATKPGSRALTLPLIACLTELALARLMDTGIDQDRRVWAVIDELPALGKLPALSSLMAEGRKYGACVLAGMQSLNQLYSQYGQYDGSSIFGQFGTAFFFRNTEPLIAKMVSSMCGSQTIIRQQKNTSFGANEFRDGVSYNEQQQKKPLVEIDDLANLAVGQCYVLLPEPKARLAKIQIEEAKISNKNIDFIEAPRKLSNTENNLLKHNLSHLIGQAAQGNSQQEYTEKDLQDKHISNMENYSRQTDPFKPKTKADFSDKGKKNETTSEEEPEIRLDF